MTRDSNDPIPKNRFQAPRHVCDLGIPSKVGLRDGGAEQTSLLLNIITIINEKMKIDNDAES